MTQKYISKGRMMKKTPRERRLDININTYPGQPLNNSSCMLNAMQGYSRWIRGIGGIPTVPTLQPSNLVYHCPIAV